MRTRVRTSRPNESVPNGWASEGGASRLRKSMSTAEYGLAAPPSVTARTTSPVIASPADAVRLRMTVRKRRDMSAGPPRVERAAGKIDERVDAGDDRQEDDGAGRD